jgi:hypothetical protein
MNNASTDKRNGGNAEHLLSDYIALCNRAIAENRDKFWYRQAKRLNRALWGGADFRTLVYDEDPDDVIGEFTIHFDPDGRELRLLPPGDHDVAFSWKVSTAYLRDVVLERPDWYLEHPAMLDWIWIRERVRDEAAEIGRIIGELHEEGGRQATRFGGDEYQTLLPGLSKEEALEVAEEIRRRVAEHAFERDDVSAKLTLSLGVATYPEDGETRAALTRAADDALYRAKRSGGNAVSE